MEHSMNSNEKIRRPTHEVKANPNCHCSGEFFNFVKNSVSPGTTERKEPSSPFERVKLTTTTKSNYIIIQYFKINFLILWYPVKNRLGPFIEASSLIFFSFGGIKTFFFFFFYSHLKTHA